MPLAAKTQLSNHTFTDACLIMFFVYSCKDHRVVRLGRACVAWWFVAVLIWINDRVFCDVWTSISFPYLHCAWHVLIFIASYTGCVLGSYFYAVAEFPQLRPTLSYWPRWSPNMGLPYILFKAMPKDKHCDMAEQVKSYGMEKNSWAWLKQELLLLCTMQKKNVFFYFIIQACFARDDQTLNEFVVVCCLRNSKTTCKL